MKDIVERLRVAARYSQPWLTEAADTIERLREQTTQAWCDTECPNRRGDIAVLLETQKRLAAMRKLVEDINCSDRLEHSFDCGRQADYKCDCKRDALQQRVDEALEAKP